MPFDHFGMPEPAYGEPLTLKDLGDIFAKAIGWVALSFAAVSWIAPLGLSMTEWVR